MSLTPEQHADAAAALRGDDGAAVRLVQSVVLGFTGPDVDGVPGTATLAALAALRPEAAPLRLAPRGHALPSATRYSLRGDGPDHPIGEHFALIEMASRDGADLVLVHPALMDLLDELRDHFGRPVTINSGYRSPSHNARIGGASQSRHKYGLAADVVVRDTPPSEVHAFLATRDPGGLGKYATFVHVDVQGYGRRWTG